MAQKSIAGNPETAKRIKDRRVELHLTIEEAAARAGVGTKTWSRYEAGESIRVDKCKGICKALNWLSFPDESNGENKQSLLEQYATHEAWSSYLEENYGKRAAFSFAVGSDFCWTGSKKIFRNWLLCQLVPILGSWIFPCWQMIFPHNS